VRIVAVLLLVAHFVAAQDMLVVAPEDFHAALTKWRAHKTAAGLRIAVEVPRCAPRTKRAKGPCVS